LVSHPLKTVADQVVKNLGDGLPAVRGSANKAATSVPESFSEARATPCLPAGIWKYEPARTTAASKLKL